MNRRYHHRGSRWRQVAVVLLCALAGCRAGSELNPPAVLPDAGRGEEEETLDIPPLSPLGKGAGKSIPAAEASPGLQTDNSSAQPPALFPPDAEQLIDLPSALALAGASNPTINMARETIRAARAEQLRANAFLLPTLNAGADFNAHTGKLESSSGIIRTVNRESVYAGAGAATVGAGTVNVPGVRAVAQVADAIFEPRIARQRVIAAGYAARATDNDVLLSVAEQYFALLGAAARVTALRESMSEIGVAERTTANFARTGQGRQADADRTASEARLLQLQLHQAEEEAAVASAELARLLDADPTNRLKPAADGLVALDLLPPDKPLSELVEVAVANRPEIASAAANIRAAEARLREENVRPFVPLLSVGYSAGGFGGGSDQTTPRFGLVSGRSDFDALAVWSLQNLGLGNRALARARQAEKCQAVADQLTAIDRVRREVAEAHATLAAARLQMAAADQRATAAERAYRADLSRTRNAEGLPIETLDSVRTLVAARQEAIAAVVAYNQAQFRLFVALGQPPPAR
jgi:outer membrane protein TolC